MMHLRAAAHVGLPRIHAMTTRTTTRTVTFSHPFALKGIEDVQPAGTYTIETDEELLEGLSFDAYRRTATVIRLPSPSGESRLDRMVPIDPVDLEAAEQKDRGAGGC